MGDAWDDDEFEAPDLSQMGPDVPNAWDDEEEFEPQPLVSHGEAPKLSAEKQAKLDQEARARKEAAIENALQDGETEAERRLRIRDEVEEADHELTEELLAGAGEGAGATKEVIVQSMEGYKLKSMKDHIIICTDLAERFQQNSSKANHAFAGVKELLKLMDGKFDPAQLGEMIGMLAAQKTKAEAALKKPTEKKKATKSQKKVNASKKEIQGKIDAHAEKFGGFVEDEYEDYQAQYDDFM